MRLERAVIIPGHIVSSLACPGLITAGVDFWVNLHDYRSVGGGS